MVAYREPKLVFPALAGFYQRVSPYSYALIRFATGAILVPHGVQKILNTPISKFAPNIAAKGLPFPELLAYLTYFAESVAAVCLAIGLFTRIAAAIIGIEMLVIVLLFQWQFGYFWTVRGLIRSSFPILRMDMPWPWRRRSGRLPCTPWRARRTRLRRGLGWEAGCFRSAKAGAPRPSARPR